MIRCYLFALRSLAGVAYQEPCGARLPPGKGKQLFSRPCRAPRAGQPSPENPMALLTPHMPNTHVRASVMSNGVDLSSSEHFKRFPTQIMTLVGFTVTSQVSRFCFGGRKFQPWRWL